MTKKEEVRSLFDITETQELPVNGKAIKSLDKAFTSAIDIIRNSVPFDQDIVYHKEIIVDKEKYKMPWEKARWYRTTELKITIKEELGDGNTG